MFAITFRISFSKGPLVHQNVRQQTETHTRRPCSITYGAKTRALHADTFEESDNVDPRFPSDASASMTVAVPE